jgi:hypothetical protein
MNGAHVLGTAAALTVSVPARATPAVELAYDAPPECPSESEFVAAMTAHGTNFGAARATPVPQIIVVSMSRAQDGFAVAFQVRDERPDGGRVFSSSPWSADVLLGVGSHPRWHQ